MGHEMGHYVLNHIPKDITFFLVVIVVGFRFLRWSLEWSLNGGAQKWQIRGISDPAVLPLAVLLVSIFFFVLTPFLNTHTRTAEAEADIFGINASRQPDGFAQAAIHLGEYRKMKPAPLEEWVFFDHPSGYNRIHMAMQWKAKNLQLFAEPAGCHRSGWHQRFTDCQTGWAPLGFSALLSFRLGLFSSRNSRKLISLIEQANPLLVIEGHGEAAKAVHADAAFLADLKIDRPRAARLVLFLQRSQLCFQLFVGGFCHGITSLLTNVCIGGLSGDSTKKPVAPFHQDHTSMVSMPAFFKARRCCRGICFVGDDSVNI